jgi:2-methylcitrate dehydratase PrpD
VRNCEVKGKATIEEYTDSAIRDPDVLAIARKVTFEIDPEAEAVYPHHYPCTVVITMKDGSSEMIHIEYPKGDPENPVTWEEAIEKFRFMAGFHYKEQTLNYVIEAVRNLEKVECTAELFAQIRKRDR